MTQKTIGIALLVLGFVACAPGNNVSQSKPTQVVVLQSVGVLSTGVSSKVGGIARIKELSNGATIIEVEITNLPLEKRSAGYIRVGSCSNPGGIAATLNEITADKSGVGISSTSVDTSKIPVSAYISFHQRGEKDTGGVGGSVTCGNL
jgi:hypothetical protein